MYKPARFGRGLSCNTQLITVIHQMFEFIAYEMTVQIATFDFAKAFDKVSDLVLTDKLHKFNIPEQIINWIGKILTVRKQQVVINNMSSKPRDVFSTDPF